MNRPLPDDPDRLLAELEGATEMLEGWKAHHMHLTILAVDAGIPIARIAKAARMTSNGVRHRVKLATLGLEHTDA
jgi:hypothetical protein